MTARYLILTTLLLISTTAFCQRPPQEFFSGLDLINTNQPEAKKDFLIAIEKDSLFHGSYHFLGVIYLGEHKPDSAIWCFKKSIALNPGDVNHTKEMAYVRLINTYTDQQDFQNAFTTAWETYKLYPDNANIASELKSICLWSFYIKYNQLNPAYLSPDIKDEYIVNSIPEEYLILRNLRVDDEPLVMSSQSLVNKKGASYDVLKCTPKRSDKSIDIYFKINWDMNKYYGGKVAPTQPVIDDTKNPVYERIGAMLVADDKTDLKTAIEKMIN
jgi:hypothetical protein